MTITSNNSPARPARVISGATHEMYFVNAYKGNIASSDAESKRRSREYERKLKADEKEGLKIEKAQVREAKRQERVQLKVKDLSSKFLIKLESFISKATLKLDFENKNKSKKKDFTTADIESLWNSRKDIIKGLVKKDNKRSD